MKLINSVFIIRTFSKNHSAEKDPHQVLGVPRGANEKEIKEAFYKLAKIYHPDNNKSDKNSMKKFQDISNAYEILTSKDYFKNHISNSSQQRSTASRRTRLNKEEYFHQNNDMPPRYRVLLFCALCLVIGTHLGI